MTPADGVTIFTIGHGDASFGDLERRMKRHRIQAIVDVRSIPYSKHAPEFAKAELEAIAAEAGLGYRWLGDHLGGRPTDAELLTDDKPDVAKITAGARFRAGIEGGLSTLIQLTGTDRSGELIDRVLGNL